MILKIDLKRKTVIIENTVKLNDLVDALIEMGLDPEEFSIEIEPSIIYYPQPYYVPRDTVQPTWEITCS